MTQASPVHTPKIPSVMSPGDYLRVARELGSGEYDLEPLRVAFLASSTLDLLRPVLVVEGARLGFELEPLFGGFAQLEQPVLDHSSELYQSKTQVLVLCFQPGELSPETVDRFHANGANQFMRDGEAIIDRLLSAAEAFGEKTGNTVLVANFAIPGPDSIGPFDASDPHGLTHQWSQLNAQLAARVAARPGVYVWDYAGLVRESGSGDWSDPRLYLMARSAVAPQHQPALARHVMRAIAATRRPPAKCLVLDLDNTLWGGVVGDDGIEGLQLGNDWPGSAFTAFQRAVLSLRDRGILLAIASKNDESVAMRAFRNHPDMVIKWEDIATARINWDPKSKNLRSIATELNIGEDALVFFDDNPVERAEVRAALPHVNVVEVPADPIRYREALSSSGFFDQLTLSPEDLKRAEMYRVERKRQTLAKEAPSLQAFLSDLEMVAEPGVAEPQTIGRIVQLIGKTNQFNLTTRRHTHSEVAQLAEAEDSVVAWLRLRDKFGDQGLIAVGILQKRSEEAWLDTFLMSCRVMNRAVERAFMAYLIEHAKALGCINIVGEFRPTAKNYIVKELLPEMGFVNRGESDGITVWDLDITSDTLEWPDHIRRVASADSRPDTLEAANR